MSFALVLAAALGCSPAPTTCGRDVPIVVEAERIRSAVILEHFDANDLGEIVGEVFRAEIERFAAAADDPLCLDEVLVTDRIESGDHYVAGRYRRGRVQIAMVDRSGGLAGDLLDTLYHELCHHLDAQHDLSERAPTLFPPNERRGLPRELYPNAQLAREHFARACAAHLPLGLLHHREPSELRRWLLDHVWVGLPRPTVGEPATAREIGSVSVPAGSSPFAVLGGDVVMTGRFDPQSAVVRFLFEGWSLGSSGSAGRWVPPADLLDGASVLSGRDQLLLMGDSGTGWLLDPATPGWRGVPTPPRALSGTGAPDGGWWAVDPDDPEAGLYTLRPDGTWEDQPLRLLPEEELVGVQPWHGEPWVVVRRQGRTRLAGPSGSMPAQVLAPRAGIGGHLIYDVEWDRVRTLDPETDEIVAHALPEPLPATPSSWHVAGDAIVAVIQPAERDQFYAYEIVLPDL